MTKKHLVLGFFMLSMIGAAAGKAMADDWTSWADWGKNEEQWMNSWQCPITMTNCKQHYGSVALRASVRDANGPVNGVAKFSAVVATTSGNVPLASEPKTLGAAAQFTTVKLAFDKERETTELRAIGAYEVNVGGRTAKAKASRLTFAPNGDAIVEAVFVLDSDKTASNLGNGPKTCSDASSSKSMCPAEESAAFSPAGSKKSI